MTRIILSTFLAAAIVGCTGFEPVGPLMNQGTPPKKSKTPPAKDLDMPPEPITIPAVQPTPPVNWVDQSDVSINPYAAAKKLAGELEADQQTIPTLPRTAEISRLKNIAR